MELERKLKIVLNKLELTNALLETKQETIKVSLDVKC